MRSPNAFNEGSTRSTPARSQHAAIDAVMAHQLGGLEAVVGIGGRREEVQDAALQAVVLDAGLRHQALECLVAVAPERDQLADVALERGVVALAEEGQRPAPLVRIETGAEQQGRIVAQEPLSDLQRRAGARPGLAEADRDLGAIGETRLERRFWLAVDDGDLVALLEQIPGGGDADDAGAEDDRFHAEFSCRAFGGGSGAAEELRVAGFSGKAENERSRIHRIPA